MGNTWLDDWDKKRKAKARRETEARTAAAELKHFKINEEERTVHVRPGYRLVTFAIDHGISYAEPSYRLFNILVRPRRDGERKETYDFYIAHSTNDRQVEKWQIFEQ